MRDDHPRRRWPQLLVLLAGAAMAVTAGASDSIALAEIELAELDEAASRATVTQILGAWGRGGEPTALRANAAGPFWAKRSGADVVLERLEAGRTRGVYRATARAGHPPHYFHPQLVRGNGAPELFFRRDLNLVAQRDSRTARAMGKAQWEFYGAARNGTTLFAAAFGIKRDGVSYVALLQPNRTPVLARLREARAGVWAPVALLSPRRAFVVYRAFLMRPMSGHGIVVESQDIANLASTKAWRPARQQYKPDERGAYYGDPSACLDGQARLHWAATIWDSRDRPTSRLVVDGVELTHSGPAGVYWLPELTWSPAFGLVVSMVGPSGNVEVGAVHGNTFVPLGQFPGDEGHVAAGGNSLYVTTSAGLWSIDP